MRDIVTQEIEQAETALKEARVHLHTADLFKASMSIGVATDHLEQAVDCLLKISKEALDTVLADKK